jgi:hypothetical protein
MGTIIGGLVTTQFEMKNKDLKLSCMSGATDVNGLVVLSIKIQGTFNGTNPDTGANGIYVSGGVAFFNIWTPGDKIKKLEIVDIDNVLGAGAGYILMNYHDEQATEANAGIFIGPQGLCEIEAFGGYGFIPSGIYIRVTAQKGSGTGTLYCNIFGGRKTA